MSCRIGGVFFAVVVLSVGALAGQEKSATTQTATSQIPATQAPAESKQETFEIKAEDAPLEWVLESFLSIASGVYGDGDHDAEAYRDFCQQYKIDSDWRSADRLGTVYREVYKEYGSRVGQARKNLEYKDLTGQDPNDWRTQALGRAFGEVYEELRSDGFPFTFDRFVAMIEARHRGGFSRYSSEPFEKKKLARYEDLFWRGAEEVSNEAALFRNQEVDR